MKRREFIGKSGLGAVKAALTAKGGIAAPAVAQGKINGLRSRRLARQVYLDRLLKNSQNLLKQPQMGACPSKSIMRANW